MHQANRGGHLDSHALLVPSSSGISPSESGDAAYPGRPDGSLQGFSPEVQLEIGL